MQVSNPTSRDGSPIATKVGDVLITVDGPVVRATIDRPEARNAINLGVLDGMEAALDLADNRRSKVLLLRGTGGTFCVGADLKLVLSLRDEDPDGLVRYATRLADVAQRLSGGGFASVCVVDGFALAAGFELLLACDVALASTDAWIGDRHLEYGLPIGTGGIDLARAAPWARARYLLLTGEMITAAEAAEWGIVSRSVSPERLEDFVAATVERLASRSGEALCAAKRMINGGDHINGTNPSSPERTIFFEHLGRGIDAREGLAAFIERRPPRFDR